MSALPAASGVVHNDLPCARCGYNLRGLAPATMCPECGQSVSHSLEVPLIDYAPAQVRWARLVLFGLVIWLVAGFESISTVLIMHFSDVYGGTVARLNYVGPKVTAVPLMQRALGYQPSAWGVNGVTRGLLIAVAIMLITTSPTERNWHEPFTSLRFYARWLPLLLLGGFLGLTLGAEGVAHRDPQVGKFTMAAIAGVELPATVLIYLHLRGLSRSLGLLRGAGTMTACAVLSAVLMIGALTLLTVGPTLSSDRHRFPLQAALSLYMAASVCTAAAALGAITRLMMELGPIALQRLHGRRHIDGVRQPGHPERTAHQANWL